MPEATVRSEVHRLNGWLDRERTIAPPGFNRWLVPPAALAVYLCIGQAYAASVYKTAFPGRVRSEEPALEA